MRLIFFVFLVCFSTGALAQEPFETWLKGFKKHAAAQGVSQKTLSRAFKDIKVNQRAIELDRNQPSAKWTFAKYRKKIVHPDRIKKGRTLYKAHYKELKAAEEKYGVPAEVIVALWGIESNYGVNTGGFDVIEALATMAWEGRRRTFFTKELVHALKIIDEGHITRAKMTGSWAGAMGQCQFMPSSFSRLARDGNGDGKKDIWNTRADVFASAANYLSQSGWKSDERWGRQVIVPKGLSSKLIGSDKKRPLAFWASKGIKRYDGGALPVVAGMKASLIAPDGLDGDSFLVYDNFRVIKKWNNSNYFAASVGLIADSIR